MRRAAFTLIELLTIIAIMGTMVAVGVVSWQRGKSRAQLAGATRDILAKIRQARSIALVTQEPAIITYQTVFVDDDDSVSHDKIPVARITIKSFKLFDDSKTDEPVYTIGGERVGEEPEPARTVPSAKSGASKTADANETEGGESLNEILMPEIEMDIVRGLRIKVLKEDELMATGNGPTVYKSAISVFSTSSAVRNRLDKNASKPPSVPESAMTDDETSDGPVDIVWSPNGRADGHTVWIYPDGSQPEKGLSIVVDRFGGCKVSQWEDEEK